MIDTKKKIVKQYLIFYLQIAFVEENNVHIPTWIMVSTEIVLVLNFIGYILGNRFLAKILFKEQHDNGYVTRLQNSLTKSYLQIALFFLSFRNVSAILGTFSLISAGLLLYVGCNADAIGNDDNGMDLHKIVLNNLPEIFLGMGIYQVVIISFDLLAYCFKVEINTSGNGSGDNAMELQPVQITANFF